jgi:serine/threonine protein kinase
MSTPLSSIVCHSCGAKFGVMVKTCTRCGETMSELLLRPGDVIGDYEIVSLLGVGGMGEVFKVRHMELETFRTIKVMRKELLTGGKNHQRFLREARIAARVQHPNVAILHGFSRLPDGSYYMVSEFIDGITLRQWLESHPRFRPDVAIEIALQVLQGLEQCHRAGLLHRDISAVNIMIGAGSVEDAVVAKIIDMGIAKVVTGPSQGDGTRGGLFIGNPRYASPEQWGALEEDEQLDGRADLYCLGVVLYEMLTGKAPFHSKTPLGYASKHLAEAPPPFARVAPEADIPAELESVVMKALQKKRQDRWASAREFARALEPLRGDQRMGTMRLRLESISSQRSAGDFSPQPTVQPSVSPAPPVMVPPTSPSGLPEKPEAAPASSDTLREPSYGEKESAAWDAAVAEETEDAWIAYLDRFSESARAHEAEQRRDEARHFSAIRPADIAGLRAFLDRWPRGARAEKARAALENAENAAGQALEAARDIAALDAFIREHRGSKVLTAAEQRREELLAAAAEAAETAAALEKAERAAEKALGAARDIPALDAFLREYPESSFRAIAEQRRQKWVFAAQGTDAAAALERAERVAEEALDAARDVAAIDAFLRDHRGSKFRAIAERRRAEWDHFAHAAQIGSVDAWQQFLARWGYGDRHVEAHSISKRRGSNIKPSRRRRSERLRKATRRIAPLSSTSSGAAPRCPPLRNASTLSGPLATLKAPWPTAASERCSTFSQCIRAAIRPARFGPFSKNGIASRRRGRPIRRKSSGGSSWCIRTGSMRKPQPHAWRSWKPPPTRKRPAVTSAPPRFSWNSFRIARVQQRFACNCANARTSACPPSHRQRRQSATSAPRRPTLLRSRIPGFAKRSRHSLRTPSTLPTGRPWKRSVSRRRTSTIFASMPRDVGHRWPASASRKLPGPSGNAPRISHNCKSWLGWTAQEMRPDSKHSHKLRGNRLRHAHARQQRGFGKTSAPRSRPRNKRGRRLRPREPGRHGDGIYASIAARGAGSKHSTRCQRPIPTSEQLDSTESGFGRSFSRVIQPVRT